MRTRMAVLLTAMLTVAATVLVVSSSSPANAQLLSEQQFGAYGSGTAIPAEALTLGTTTTGNVHAARSSGAVNSQGLSGTINDEFGEVVSPPLPGKNAYGRGTGLEAGLLVPDVQQVTANQLLLAGLAQASAPPPQGPVVEEIALDLSPIAFASLLRGEAQAIYDPNICAIGQPITFGRGLASNLQLLGEPGAAAVATDVEGDNASDSRTFTYFIPNGDGTFGLVSETRQHVAPISLLNTPLGPTLTLEVAGEFGLRATATGKPGGASIEFLGNPIITVGTLGTEVISIALSDILGPEGLTVDVPGVATVSLGQAPRAIGGAPGTAPTIAADGTSASAAVDVVARLELLEALGVLDLGAGHMEAAVQVPAGGIRCNIPVAKTATPNPATVGQDVTWTIRIPSDPETFARFFACDLLNISATDTHRVLEGNPRFQLTGASHGGVISGNTVTWPNLGNYRRGDPPIVVTVTGRILGGSGLLEDTVNVTATLGNCTGGIEGTIAGLAQFQNAGLTGTVTLRGPEVGRGDLAATGGDSRYLVLGGVLLLGALGIRRRLKTRSETTG